MDTIAILERRPTLSAFLARRLPQWMKGWGEVLPLGDLPSGQVPDLLVVSPDLVGPPPAGTACRVLLVPGRLAPLAWEIPAQWAVSYGSSPRDSLSFSSFGEKAMGLALQRELVTLRGTRLERQEIMLPCCGCRAPLHLVACAGVQLLVGVEPGKVGVRGS
jgi:hypothetical protein